jgi:hypothetical protein
MMRIPVSRKRKKIGVAGRVSERHQRLHLTEQIRVCLDFAKQKEYDVIKTIKVVAPVWSSRWKRKLTELARYVKDQGGEAILFETTLRAQKSRDWSTSNPFPRLNKEEYAELERTCLGLELIFVEDSSFHEEHSLQIKRGKPGRPITRITAKAIAAKLRMEGCSLREIQRELLQKRYKISLMGISKWIAGFTDSRVSQDERKSAKDVVAVEKRVRDFSSQKET